MALRFRKSIRIAKGIRLNLGKTGASLSLGGRGGSINLSSRGVRSSVGIPGTGISFSSSGGGKRSRKSAPEVRTFEQLPEHRPMNSYTNRQPPSLFTYIFLGFFAAIFFPALAVAISPEGFGPFAMIVTFGLTIGSTVKLYQSNKVAHAQRLERLRLEQAEREAAEQKARDEEWARLVYNFGKEGAQNVQQKRLWLGAPHTAVTEMFGPPLARDEKVKAGLVVHTCKYFSTGANRYALRVTLENGRVTEWDDKR